MEIDEYELEERMAAVREHTKINEHERIFRAVEKRMNWLGVEKFLFIKKCIYDEK